MATSGHIWVADAWVQGAGCVHTCLTCSHPFLLFPFPPWFTAVPMGTRKQVRLPLGQPHYLPLGKETSAGNHLGGTQGTSRLPSVFTQFLLPCFSYCKALPEQCQEHKPPMDNVQDLTLCAKESLTHLQLQGCQLTPPYLPPQL